MPSGRRSDTVLLTNLANRVQPIIRYDLGDRLTLCPDPCPCGNPLPAIRVEGRTDDILRLRSPSGVGIALAPQAIPAILEGTPGVHRFQVIQSGPDTLRVRFDADPSADGDGVCDAVRGRLGAYLAQQGLPAVIVERATEPPSRNPISGKFREV